MKKLSRPKLSDSKQRLLDTACDLISRSSYGSVSVDKLCKAGGVQKGSFYYFFKSKAELAVASLEYTWEQMRGRYEQVFDRRRPPLERLEKYFGYIIEVQTRNRNRSGYVVGSVYTAIGCEMSRQNESIRLKVEEINAQKCAYIAAAISDAQASGLLGNTTPAEILARELQALLLGLMLVGRIHNDMAPILNMRHSACQLLGLSQPA